MPTVASTTARSANIPSRKPVNRGVDIDAFTTSSIVRTLATGRFRIDGVHRGANAPTSASGSPPVFATIVIVREVDPDASVNCACGT